MRGYVKKSKNGALYAADEETRGYLKRRKAGQVLRVEVIQEHNYDFHKKLMALFLCVHNNLPDPEPVEFMGEWITPNQTFNNTRKYLTVKAGYYEVNGYPNGSVRVEAKSISYAKMSDEEKETLYSDVINAALKTLPSGWSMEKLDQVANEILRFD